MAWPFAQRPPSETGWFGLPSTLIALPSRVRTHIPHWAEQPPQTVVYQVDTPGVISSGATTYGSRRSTFSVEHPVSVAPAPDTPSTLKKSRRLIPSFILLFSDISSGTPCSQWKPVLFQYHPAGGGTPHTSPYCHRPKQGHDCRGPAAPVLHRDTVGTQGQHSSDACEGSAHGRQPCRYEPKE